MREVLNYVSILFLIKSESSVGVKKVNSKMLVSFARNNLLNNANNRKG
jgi:hypothetical protein